MKVQITINVSEKSLLRAITGFIEDGDTIGCIMDGCETPNIEPYNADGYNEKEFIARLIKVINANKYDLEFEDADGNLRNFKVFNNATVKTIVEKLLPHLNLKKYYDEYIAELDED